MSLEDRVTKLETMAHPAVNLRPAIVQILEELNQDTVTKLRERLEIAECQIGTLEHTIEGLEEKLRILEEP